MSHYAVAVFADSPDDFDRLLAPFDENSHFTRHVLDEKDLRDRYKKFLEQNPSWEELGFDHWIEDFGYKREGEEIAAYYNDNAKWDWYTLDGKDYLFDLTEEAENRLYDEEDGDDIWCHRKNDYVYDTYDAAEESKHRRFWELVVEGAPLNEGEKEPFSVFKKEYYLDKYGDKENFVRHSCITTPWAFITPDGVWHAPGNVGWFAADDATRESLDDYVKEWFAYVSDKSKNPYVSFVDCHI